MVTHQLYVFAPPLSAPAKDGGQLQSQPVVCGRIDWAAGTGTFRYAPDWLASPLSYPLDPVNLPLTEIPSHHQVNKGVPGVLADTGPDSWGARLIERHRGVLESPLERLRLTNGTGTGCLLYSSHRERPNPPRSVLSRLSLSELEDAARKFDAGQPLDDEKLQELMAAGSGLGGARPKALVEADGREYLAKFGKQADTLDMQLLEHACLTLASRAGIATVAHRLTGGTDHHVLLVERFDRDGDRKLHYMSFHALLSAMTAGPSDVEPGGNMTYAGLAVRCRAIGVPDAQLDLYRRMVFNALVGNTDDHLRNHGLIFDGQWRLAPAFDLVTTGGPKLAIGAGPEGRMRSLRNVMLAADLFDIKRDHARQIVDEIGQVLGQMPDLLSGLGMPDGEIGQVVKRMALPD